MRALDIASSALILPLVGVEVILRPGRVAPGNDAGARVHQTTANGTFRFDSLVPVDYVMQFKKFGFETQWHRYRGITAAVDSLCVYMRAAPLFKLAPPETHWRRKITECAHPTWWCVVSDVLRPKTQTRLGKRDAVDPRSLLLT